MAAPAEQLTDGPAILGPRQTFSLQDRYQLLDGPIYLSGIQALVRMLLDRSRHDRQLGANIATYVSGYEGSPLAGYDLELARNARLLSEHTIVHQPGLNEELAATAVSGTQLANRVATGLHDGVTGIWYGKAPGLDRATDAIRHANLIGTDGKGGVVALVGDDPAAKSSSVPCASEAALADLFVPTLFPADPAEVLEFGQHAIELSRASGLWTALKIVTNVADGASTAAVTPTWQAPSMTELPGRLRAYQHRPNAHLLGDSLADLESSQQLIRLPLAMEYLRRSGVNRILGSGPARLGIVAAGKTYLDLRQALAALGLGESDLSAYGIRLLKLGALYPLEPSIVREFARGLDEIVVVEDKRAFLEDAIKAVLYGQPDTPAVHGKRGPDGAVLFSAVGELDPDKIVAGIAPRLNVVSPQLEPVRQYLHRQSAAAGRPRERIRLPMAPRTPYFCSGCPHNSSTKVAPDTLVGGGIGCHSLVLFMPEQQVGTVTGLSQMGGEGAQWIGMSPFVTQQHYVQNIGDGTFAHSGSLAVRAAVAAGVNVTFKLLYNSAVAMTGGQQAVGGKGLDKLIDLLKAEGVARVTITTEQPAVLRKQLGRTVEIRPRSDMMAVQEELAQVPGVTVLVHDQECAAEKRRKRRRSKMETPVERVVINERVCEGCGDCGAKSNCLSVEPVATEFGRKTQINQSSCNLDFSCQNGDCPSFLTVVPGNKRTPRLSAATRELSTPDQLYSADGFAMRIAGVGGTGITTVAQILATAAFLDGRYVRSLDQTGVAQKGGAVLSDLKITSAPEEQGAKLMEDECDLYLGCDSLVAADEKTLRVATAARTTAVVSTSEVPTGAMVVDTGVAFPPQNEIVAALSARARKTHLLDARSIARAALDDEQYANMVTVGAAYQAGALPLTLDSLQQAIRLNGVAVDKNLLALSLGRHAVAGVDTESEQRAEPAVGKAQHSLVARVKASAGSELARVVAIRVAELVAYQNAGYAARYVDFVEHVRQAEEALPSADNALATAVAHNLYKLMAYKDEYEVARLSLDPGIDAKIGAQFGEGSKVSYRLHPPMLRSLGMTQKITFGPWFRSAFQVLYAARRLRGTPLDLFGYAHVRRVERALVDQYRAAIESTLEHLDSESLGRAVQIAELPDVIRGYEHIKLRNVEVYRSRLEELTRAPSTV